MWPSQVINRRPFCSIQRSYTLIRSLNSVFISLKFKPSKRHTDTKVVMTSDLEGFWEMIEIQVKDVEKKFIYLEKCKIGKRVLLMEKIIAYTQNVVAFNDN